MSTNTNTLKKERNSSIELLRIISMIMIIFFHFAYHGGFEWVDNSVSLPHFWYNLLSMGGKIGVDVFVMISGYFLSKSKSGINFLKVVKFWLQLIFYSVSIYITCSLTGIIDFNAKEMVYNLLPIITEKWWFASTYFVLFIIHPFINIFLDSIDKRTHKKLLLILILIWSIIPTFTNKPFLGNDLTWFITLYCISGYIGKYGLNARLTHKQYLISTFAFFTISYLTSFIFTVAGTKIALLNNYITYFYKAESVTTLLISVSLFMTFITLKVKQNNWINILGSATFGVYLIHDNRQIRELLWNECFVGRNYSNSILLIPFSIVVVFTVFIACSLIELIRQNLIEKRFIKMLSSINIKRIFSNKLFALVDNFVFGTDE